MRDVHDLIHLAGNTSVVDGHNHSRTVRYRRLDLCLVNVHGIGPDIHEHQGCTHHLECSRCRRECETWENDLVTRLEIAEDGSHLECCSAARCQEGLPCAKAILEPFVALHAERSVTTNLVVLLARLADVLHLAPNKRRYVEVNQRKPPRRDTTHWTTPE